MSLKMLGLRPCKLLRSHIQIGTGNVLDNLLQIAFSNRLHTVSCSSVCRIPRNNFNHQVRKYSSEAVRFAAADFSGDSLQLPEFPLHKKVLYNLGFRAGLKLSLRGTRIAGLNTYRCCLAGVNHEQFFKEFELPDTFNSWFIIQTLHIWMCMVRLSQEDYEGHFIKHSLVHNLWEDVQSRSKELLEHKINTKRGMSIQFLDYSFKAAVISYDEGLLSSDVVLAGAVWRIFFMCNPEADITQIETLVKYIRKQILYLDSIPSEVVLTGFLKFLPIYGDYDPGTDAFKESDNIFK